MNVYIVYEAESFSEINVTGVFSSKEKAIHAIEEHGFYDYIRSQNYETVAPVDEDGFGWFKKARKDYEMMPQAWIEEVEVDTYKHT